MDSCFTSDAKLIVYSFFKVAESLKKQKSLPRNGEGYQNQLLSFFLLNTDFFWLCLSFFFFWKFNKQHTIFILRKNGLTIDAFIQCKTAFESLGSELPAYEPLLRRWGFRFLFTGNGQDVLVNIDFKICAITSRR
jgi:hypothetical protein